MIAALLLVAFCVVNCFVPVVVWLSARLLSCEAIYVLSEQEEVKMDDGTPGRSLCFACAPSRVPFPPSLAIDPHRSSSILIDGLAASPAAPSPPDIFSAAIKERSLPIVVLTTCFGGYCTLVATVFLTDRSNAVVGSLDR